jgi:hypothetical protein
MLRYVAFLSKCCPFRLKRVTSAGDGGSASCNGGKSVGLELMVEPCPATCGLRV